MVFKGYAGYEAGVRLARAPYLRGISGSFLAMGMASAAIMKDFLVKGIGPAAGAPRFPGALLIQQLPIPSRIS